MVSVVTVVMMKITLEICFNNGGDYGDLLVMVMVTVTDLVTIIWDKRIKLRGSEGAKVLCFFMVFFFFGWRNYKKCWMECLRVRLFLKFRSLEFMN